jgi:hypothetical protein
MMLKLNDLHMQPVSQGYSVASRASLFLFHHPERRIGPQPIHHQTDKATHFGRRPPPFQMRRMR